MSLLHRPLVLAWGALCSVPVAMVFEEAVLGFCPGPIANTAGTGPALVLRLTAPSRGRAVIFKNPFSPGHYAAGIIVGLPGEDGLQSGQLFIEAARDGEVDSHTLGPIPATLVAGIPVLYLPALS
jgi:hypothetical protein